MGGDFAIHHLVTWLQVSLPPTLVLGVARLLSAGTESVLEYLRHAAGLFGFVSAGGVVTVAWVKKHDWQRNTDFDVTVSQLHDPALRRSCRRLLVTVREICRSALLLKWAWPGARRILARHSAAARRGAATVVKVERHIRWVRALAIRTT